MPGPSRSPCARGAGLGRASFTLDFRRPKKPRPRLLIYAVAAVLVALTIVVGVASALDGGGEKKDESNKSTAAATKMSSATPTPTPTPDAAESAATEVITPRNNPNFAALLKKRDPCDDANLKFATRYEGRTIVFNGSIAHMMLHGDYNTRYDLLLGPGDKGPNTGFGPNFKYEDVSIFDLKLTGKEIPDTIGAGDKFRFVAKVREFNAIQCLFYLEPVSTKIR